MVTDRRSAKCSDLTTLPQAEIAWYFRESREQFRFSGEISLVLESESLIRRAAFSRLSPAAKVQFLWPDPGQPRRPEQNVDFQVSLDPAGMSEPPDNFAILILSINAVDHLILDGTPQNRIVYGLNSIGGWKAVEVNP
jgi:PPOX class probable FMN-dependent enzyme